MHSLADEIKCEENGEAVELPTEPVSYLVEPQQQDSCSEDEMVSITIIMKGTKGLMAGVRCI